jgi:hypothetical protein
MRSRFTPCRIRSTALSANAWMACLLFLFPGEAISMTATVAQSVTDGDSIRLPGIAIDRKGLDDIELRPADNLLGHGEVSGGSSPAFNRSMSFDIHRKWKL